MKNVFKLVKIGGFGGLIFPISREKGVEISQIVPKFP